MRGQAEDDARNLGTVPVVIRNIIVVHVISFPFIVGSAATLTLVIIDVSVSGVGATKIAIAHDAGILCIFIMLRVREVAQLP